MAIALSPFVREKGIGSRTSLLICFLNGCLILSLLVLLSPSSSVKDRYGDAGDGEEDTSSESTTSEEEVKVSQT